jgi:adenylate cyclase class IV
MTSPTETAVKCELRSLISREQHEALQDFFSNVGTFVGEDHQETRYFDGDRDLRIQKSGSYARVWLRKGKAIDDSREEIELRIEPERFGELERLFEALEFKTAIIWLRHRVRFEWDGVGIALDGIKGYGFVAEFCMTCDPDRRLETLDVLRAKMAMLGLKPTPKPMLHARFSEYRDHWKELIKEEGFAGVTEEKKMPA